MFNELTVISAVPGAGKTTYMIREAVRLIHSGEYRPQEIAFVTFTKNAANMAKDRMFLALYEGKGAKIKGRHCHHNKFDGFRTLHAMCFRALGIHRSDMEVYSNVFHALHGYKTFNNNKEMLMYSGGCAGTDMRIVKRDNGTLLQHLSLLYRANPKAYEEEMRRKSIKGAGITHALVVKYMMQWEEYKNAVQEKIEFNGVGVSLYRKYDYTDLMEQYIEEKFTESDRKVVFIDEAQDISTLQWKLIYQAFGHVDKAYVVADPRQNMFKWAGSDVDIFLNLHGTDTQILDTNYRCYSNIVDFVEARIIPHIQEVDHLDIKMRPTNDGGKVETLYALDELLKDSEFTNPRNTVMLLATTTYLAQKYRDWCISTGVPYYWMGNPVFTNEDKQKYRDTGRIPDSWPTDKRLAAQSFISAGTFYLEPNVYINTLHASKGEEADIVVVNTDMSTAGKDAFLANPYYTDLAFYVGCTRAKRTLYIFRDVEARSTSRRYTRI